MTHTKVNFAWNQQLESYHPDFNIWARFTGWAAITGDTVEIKSCRVKWDGSLEGEELSVLEGAVGSMQNFFLGKCREAARKSLAKMQEYLQAETVEDLKSKHKHNADFWPRATSTKYMNEE